MADHHGAGEKLRALLEAQTRASVEMLSHVEVVQESTGGRVEGSVCEGQVEVSITIHY